MADDRTQPTANDRPEQEMPERTKLERAGQRPSPQNQANSAAQPSQRVAPGRRPLFRT